MIQDGLEVKRLDLRVMVATVSLVIGCAGPARSAPPTVLPEAAPAVVPPPSAGSLETRLRKSSKLAPILDQAPTYRFQVLVSVPAPDGSGWLEREGFRVDAEYFYPASAMKLCTAVAALEALADLREAKGSDLDVGAMLLTDSASKRRGGATSVSNLVLGSLVVSDNDASNDLFDLVGFDGLHERMWRMGLSSVRVRHRLGAATGDPRLTPRITLASPGSEPIVIPAREGRVTLEKNDQPGVLVGESHISSGGRIVDEPMSFEEKNRISLADLQELLIGVMRPELRPSGAPRFGAQERSVLASALTAFPSARGAGVDREHKPFLEGIERVVPRTSLTLASKSGRAYGFLVENAYVHDARSGRSFFLTAAIYANANGRLNDDLYEYGSIAFPVFAELGEVVARTVLDAPAM